MGPLPDVHQGIGRQGRRIAVFYRDGCPLSCLSHVFKSVTQDISKNKVGRMAVPVDAIELPLREGVPEAPHVAWVSCLLSNTTEWFSLSRVDRAILGLCTVCDTLYLHTTRTDSGAASGAGAMPSVENIVTCSISIGQCLQKGDGGSRLPEAASIITRMTGSACPVARFFDTIPRSLVIWIPMIIHEEPVQCHTNPGRRLCYELIRILSSATAIVSVSDQAHSLRIRELAREYLIAFSRMNGRGGLCRDTRCAQRAASLRTCSGCARSMMTSVHHGEALWKCVHRYTGALRALCWPPRSSHA
jgi:hypothetical protein